MRQHCQTNSWHISFNFRLPYAFELADQPIEPIISPSKSRGIYRSYKSAVGQIFISLFHRETKRTTLSVSARNTRFRMPETTLTNGYSNGHHTGYEMEDGNEFLFTSESVGEGHPGRSIWLRRINKRRLLILNTE